MGILSPGSWRTGFQKPRASDFVADSESPAAASKNAPQVPPSERRLGVAQLYRPSLSRNVAFSGLSGLGQKA